MLNWYVTRTLVKDALNIPAADTGDDDQLDAVIEAVSRGIEEYCGRWFYPAVETRYYTARESGRLIVDDLLSITTLKTDDDGNGVYENTWAATDYHLMPFNALSEKPPSPYWLLRTTPDGNYSFPSTEKGVQLVGSFGRYDVRRTSSATLAENLDTTETGVDVSSGTAFEVGQTILIGTEQMWISAISSNTLTVTRGVNGTTAAVATSGAAIQIYEYPIVGHAAKIQAAMDFKAKDMPGGTSGSGEFGAQTMIVNAGLHPFVRRMLSGAKLRVVA